MLQRSSYAAVLTVSSWLNIPPSTLAALIDFETAGTWRPDIQNPNSSATGLLQFIDATARQLGYASAADLVRNNPTVSGQLKGPVYKYLSRFSPFKSLQSLAMSVFYPAYRSASLDTVFPRSVRAVNPGIHTVGDYVKRVADRVQKYKHLDIDKKASSSAPAGWSAEEIFIVGVLAGAVVFVVFRILPD